MWTHFHPATKKKSTKGACKLRAKERLAAIKTIESSVDDSVVSIFADNCADLLEYLDNNWNIGHNGEQFCCGALYRYYLQFRSEI